MHGGALLIREDLHFHVTWSRQVALEKQAVVFERGSGEALCRRERRPQLGELIDDVHSLAATASARFDDEREAHLRGIFLEFVRALLIAVIPGERWNARLL